MPLIRITKFLGAMFAAVVATFAVMLSLHTFSDFDVFNGGWWFWLVKYPIINPMHFPYPYFQLLLVWPLVFFPLAFGIDFFAFKKAGYGDARFATLREVRKKLGLSAKRGLVLGRVRGKTIYTDKTRHGMIVAPTQSGKTANLIIPSVLAYPGSIISIDPKGDVFEATAGYRNKLGPVYRLEWTSQKGARYNPISVRLLPFDPIELEQRIAILAALLVDDDDEFFGPAARGALNGLLLLEVLDARAQSREADMTAVASWQGRFSDEDQKRAKAMKFPDMVLAKIENSIIRAEAGYYPERCISELYTLKNQKSDKTRDSILGTVSAQLEIFRSAAVASTLSGLDFTPEDFLHGKPSTLYIVTNANDEEFTSKLTAMLLTSFIYSHISRTKREASKHKSVWYSTDEWSSLKKMQAFKKLFDVGAGLRTHATVVLQDFSQAAEIYGDNALDTFINNSEYISVFSQSEEKTRRKLSELVGKTTRRRKSNTVSDDGRRSESDSDEGVPLIMPQEWGNIPQYCNVLLQRGFHTRPVQMKGLDVENDKEFAGRYGLPVPDYRP